jgi:hypothetical protein
LVLVAGPAAFEGCGPVRRESSMRAAVVGRLKQPPVIEGRSVHTREQDPIEARTAPGGAGPPSRWR